MSVFLTDPVFDEINQTVVSALGLTANAVVTKATKFVRFDWRALIEYFKTVGSGGLETPYCIIRPAPTIEADWGMQNHAMWLPLEIFLIEDEANKIQTTVATTNNTPQTVIPVLDSSRMFIGQRLFFVFPGAYVFVVSVDSPTQITISSAQPLSNGSAIISDITSDVERKIEILREKFLQGTVYNNFQLMEDPLTDVSDMNPANELEQGNYTLLAGSCYIKPLIGHTL